jgi:hypothetical protein
MRRAMTATVLMLSCVGSSFTDAGQGGNREKRIGTRDRGFVFCRLRYERVRSESDGNGWSTDYPQADRNLMVRFSELSYAEVDFAPGAGGRRFPNHWIVKADGTIGWSEEEVQGLQRYFAAGGFLWVDDFWGPDAWWHWVSQIRRVLPSGPIFDIPPSHPILSGLTVPQVSHIGFWKSHSGETSERGEESAEVHVRGIEDQHGNLLVLMTHNTDVSDTFEREYDEEFFDEFALDGYSIGVSVLLYTMTH